MKDSIKVSDLVIDLLHSKGVDTFFGVTGGAVVHLFDSIERKEGTSAIYFNHEQSASFAVESYAKSRQGLGVGIFTTGPGATNALTGLAAAWLDSVPCIFISGQSRSTSTIGKRNLRQVGTQEVNIIEMVKSVTKYAVTVENINDIKYHFDKAIHLAQSGRPGPVWIDIPVDFSWSSINLSDLTSFNPEIEFKKNENPFSGPLNPYNLEVLLNKSERPLFLVGQGCRLSGSEDILKEFILKSSVPFVTTWNMCDFMDFNEDLNIGRAGISGQRGANLAIQNCDLLICLGTHLNNSITGTIFDAFARDAKTIVVDIDKDELDHIPVEVDFKVNCDVKDFMAELNKIDYIFKKNKEFWINKYNSYSKLNDFSEKYSNLDSGINSLYFKKVISENAEDNTVFVTDGGGTNVYSSLQSCFNRGNQKLILSTGLCSMGSGIPEAIGAYYGNLGSPVFCFVGDGSFPFNMQELQLIKDLNLPIKIFILNNNGYTSIKTTQEDFLEGNLTGSTPDTGVHLIDVSKTATNFELEYLKLKDVVSFHENIRHIIDSDQPMICEVMLPTDEIIEPRQGFKLMSDNFVPQPLEDMFPFLQKEEFEELMIVDSWEDMLKIKQREIDLLRSYPKSTRELGDRRKRKLSGKGYINLENSNINNSDTFFEQLLLKKAREFGEIYFDGDRLYGYGGYFYKKKYWNGVAIDIIENYQLKPGSKVLEVGCAKGFLLNDLLNNIPELVVRGIDISDYAVKNSMESVRNLVSVGDAKDLPFEDNEFDLVLSINTLSELEEWDCRKALKEIQRVTKKDSFVTLNSWDNDESKDRFTDWNITAPTNFSKKRWIKIFSEESFEGDFNWFTL